MPLAASDWPFRLVVPKGVLTPRFSKWYSSLIPLSEELFLPPKCSSLSLASSFFLSPPGTLRSFWLHVCLPALLWPGVGMAGPVLTAFAAHGLGWQQALSPLASRGAV